MPKSYRSDAQLDDAASFAYLSLHGGKMGALLQATDWSKTPLENIASWPQSLRTVVRIILNSRHPMYLAWGPQLLFLFNDAYRPLLGAKAADPADALGKPFAELWSEVWPQLKPEFDKVLSGIPVWADDVPMTLKRNGHPEEAFFTYSLSPVRDELDHVTGVFCACIETTDKVLNCRELASSTEKLQLVTEAAELGMFDHDLLTDEMVWSARAKGHLGLPPKATITPADFIAALHPDDRERVSDIMNALLASGSDGRYQVDTGQSGKPMAGNAGSPREVRYILTMRAGGRGWSALRSISPNANRSKKACVKRHSMTA